VGCTELEKHSKYTKPTLGANWVLLNKHADMGDPLARERE